MRHISFPDGVTRQTLADWFNQGRRRTQEIFSIPIASAYYDRPIALRNPIVFYEGHLPAFTINTLIKLALKEQGLNERYEVLFERGIDPDSPEVVRDPGNVWPPRHDVQSYGRVADARIEQALLEGTIEKDDFAPLRNGEAALAILEHEQMHQETLLYMMHNLPLEKKKARPALSPAHPLADRDGAVGDQVFIPAGVVTLGADRDDIGFGWDNEFPMDRVEVAGFTIDRYNVTNGEYLEFMSETGAAHPNFWQKQNGSWFWRGMFDLLPLPLEWPVYTTHAEAAAYAGWKGKRLPSEAEYHRAAFGTPEGEERRYPWGNELPDASRGNFGFTHWDPVPTGSYPAGASAWGVHDLAGNGWEWTSTVFGGYSGFEPMACYPVYSTDFFDGQHYVLKGASQATAPQLIRRSFRNWFRPNYPYVYASFRCVSPAPPEA